MSAEQAKEYGIVDDIVAPMRKTDESTSGDKANMITYPKCIADEGR